MSGLWKLGWKDLLKGLIMVIFAGGIYALLTNLDMLPYMENPAVRATASTFLSYLLKNLFTDEQGKFIGKV